MSKLINDSGDLIFLGAEQRTAKSGNLYTIVTIADTKEFQQHHLFKSDDCTINGLQLNDRINVILDLQTVGYNQNLTLLKIEKHK